jgi:hypothetical protein
MSQMSEAPIVRLLMTEAEAWRALIALQNQATHLTTQIGITDDSLGTINFNESMEMAAQRESTYIAALSQLAASLDNAQAEVVRLRGLRKAKHSVESSAFREVLQAHSDEVLALGESMARSASLDMASTASSVRQASFRLKAAARDANALLAALNSCVDLPVKDGESIVVGIAKGGIVTHWVAASDVSLNGGADRVVSTIREMAHPMPSVSRTPSSSGSSNGIGPDGYNHPPTSAKGRSFVRREAPT